MSPIRFIRTHVFKATQQEFSDLAGVGQGTVSRWENGGSPSLEEMQRIRSSAFERGIEWNDTWFFSVPEAAE